MATQKWYSYCDRGCSTFLGSPTTKREAEREATSHMNSYGHSTGILPVTPHA